MSESSSHVPPVVVVTGGNGFVGSHTCAALAERGATVRAVVRRPGTAPRITGVEEHVGEFFEPAFVRSVLAGADAVVSTVHPMGSEREQQERIGVRGTSVLAATAGEAGVARLVHLSTASVYARSPGMGDVDEGSPLVADDANDYAVTKRDTDAALERVDGLTRVLLRPPAILGTGESSVWNTLRPAGLRDDASARRANPEQTFAWVHVRDLSALAADVATGRIEVADDADLGPVAGRCTAVNVAGEPATARDYYGTVTRALGVEPQWTDDPPWRGQVSTARARRWGWTAEVTLSEALAELAAGLRR